MALRENILNAMRQHPGELFKTNELSKMVRIKSDSDEYQSLRHLLDEMVRDGDIIRETRRRYGLPRPVLTEIEGELRIQPTGNGIVTPFDQFDLGDTVLIRSRNLLTAMDGDNVRVHLFAGKQGERPQGEVVAVLKSVAHHLTGFVQKTRQGHFVRPEGSKMHRDVFIARKDLHGAKEGDRVRIELYDWTDEYIQPEGFILEVLSKPEAQTSHFDNEAIIAEYNLPREFPPAVEKEAAKFPVEIPEAEIKKRLDLRGETIFTIDPEDAKDFDDAVSLTKNDDGTVTLGVHIADVSHYVTEGSSLDNEALERGTSVYLVGGVIPMLPERLSNGLCSLRPDEDKLTYSVFMRIDPETGAVKRSEMKKTVIRSVMRFSYEEAEARTTSGRGKYAKLLREMRALSQKMYERRREAGSIDFESEEFRFKFENGEPVEAYRKERLGSMRMIEDFMLAANRAVAEFIARKSKQGTERPFIYRIHADPDPAKVRDVAMLAKTLGYKLSPENPTPKTIQKFLESLKGKPEAHLLNTLMLRAMAKAVYAEHNVGHFGLAFLHYTHFTSPIRRYPDLIVHRMLFEYSRPGGMNREREHYYLESLPEIAEQTSALERRATEAERESTKLAQIHLMKDKIGEEFDGIISGVTHFGIFVEVANGAEGLVHIRELPGYYEFDEAHYTLTERRGMHGGAPRRFRIGDAVRVQLVKVLEEKRKMDFRLAETGDATQEGFTPEKAQRQRLLHERRTGHKRGTNKEFHKRKQGRSRRKS